MPAWARRFIVQGEQGISFAKGAGGARSDKPEENKKGDQDEPDEDGECQDVHSAGSGAGFACGKISSGAPAGEG